MALYAFIPFTFLYFISRIIAVPLLLCWPIYKLDTSHAIWISSNILINTIYVLQLYWFKCICVIIAKTTRKQT
jgi:hypothetical protein